MVKKLGKPTKILLLSIIFFSILLILLNVFIAAFSTNIVSYLNKHDIGGILKVREINSLFLPFYIKAKNVSFTNQDVKFNIRKINIDLSIKNMLMSKPFIKISAQDVDADINVVKTDKSNFNILDYISYIDLFDVEKSNVKIKYDKIKSVINLKTFKYSSNNKYLNYEIYHSTISKDNITETFTSVFKGKVINDKLKITLMELEGDSVYLKSDNLTLSNKHINGFIEGKVGDKILNIFYPDIKGTIFFKSHIKDSRISFAFKTDRFEVNNNPLNVKGQIFGHFPGLLKYDVCLNKIFGYDFKIKGNYNTKTLDIMTNIDFKKPVDIYKGHGWHVFIDDTFIKGNIKENKYYVNSEVTSEETYKVSAVASIDYNNFKVYLNDLTGKSKNTEIHGKAITDFKSIKITASGKGNGNEEVKKILKINAKVSSDFEFYVDNKKLNLKGTYKTEIPQKIYNIDIDKASGDFDLSYKGIKFNTDALLDNGSLQIIGDINFRKSLSVFDFNMKSVKFSHLLNYFEVKNDVQIPLTGKARLVIDNENISSEGYFKAANAYVTDNLIKYKVKDKKLRITYLKAENLVFTDLFTIDFKNKSISGDVRKDMLKFRDYPKLMNVDLQIRGDLKKPNINGKFDVKLDKIGKLNFTLTGNFNELNFFISKKNLSSHVAVDINNKKVQAYLKLQNYVIDEKNKIFTTGKIKLNSDDLKTVYGYGDKIILNVKNKKIDFKEVSFNSDFKSINNLNAEISSEFFDNVKLNNFVINKKFIKGFLFFKNTEINYNDINLYAKGNILAYYNFQDKPELFGDLDFTGYININKYALKLPVNKGFIRFFEYETSIFVQGKELDMNYNVTAHLPKYYNPLSLDLNLTGKNLFINVNDTSVSFDTDATFDNESKTLNANIFINQLNIGNLNIKSESKPELKLPFNIALNINTKNPVHIENKFSDVFVNIDLKINMIKNKLNLTGLLNTENGKIDIAGNSFILRNGYLKFSKNDRPYLFVKANGTGRNSSITLKVTGFLPEYNVELIDKNPDNSISFESNSNILTQHTNKDSSKNKSSKMLLTELLNGAMLNRIINVAENSLGINRIGFEQNKYKGDESNYIKIGKSFSDRLEVKYVVATGKNEESSIVGEYLLMDWLRLVVYATVDGGNGAGFNFFGNF